MRDLLRELGSHLSRLGIPVQPVQQPADPDARGADIFSQLAIGVVSGGALVALIDCLKSYLSRDSKIAIELKNADGRQVSITAQNVDSASIKASLEAVVSASAK